MRTLSVLFGVVALSFFAVGCASTSTAGSAVKVAAQACSCSVGKAGGTTWCEACSVGYAKGKKTACKGCVTKAESGKACPGCDKADAKACACSVGKAGGTTWCDGCSVGYVDGKKMACKGCVTKAQGGEGCSGCAGK